MKEAFNWLYGVPVTSGNGAWRRRMLLGRGQHGCKRLMVLQAACKQQGRAESGLRQK